MLAEGIVGEEDFLFRAVSYHVVRPMKHRRGNKGKGALADGKGISAFYSEVSAVAVMGGKAFCPCRAAGVNSRIGAML